MADLQQLYKDDFVAWTRDQAEALRNVPRDRLLLGLAQALDWDNLAEEIESLGGSQRLALTSQIKRIIHHLLKLEFSSAEEPRNAWRQSIREARDSAYDLIEANPSLKRDLVAIVGRQGPKAIKLALSNLEDYGELDQKTAAFLLVRHYDLETEILSDWMPERRTAD